MSENLPKRIRRGDNFRLGKNPSVVANDARLTRGSDNEVLHAYKYVSLGIYSINRFPVHLLLSYLFDRGALFFCHVALGNLQRYIIEMESSHSLRVRKGAWSKEEDVLLKNCVEHYGEGKWHLVPVRTGLNRCRKSCRLRWLNYLRPNITRGNFTKDEVDLLIRMHQLLGNRWSLIAGRLPGRTANDVKNFWNTRMNKKSGEGKGQPIQKTITKTNILRPRPRTFSKITIQDGPRTAFVTDHNHERNNPNKNINNNNDNILEPPSSQEANECIRWWSNLLDAAGEDKLEKDIPFLYDKGKEPGLWTGQINPGGLMDDGDDSLPASEDFEFYDDAWELLGFGNYQNNL